jgi:hypothetical protein
MQTTLPSMINQEEHFQQWLVDEELKSTYDHGWVGVLGSLGFFLLLVAVCS